MTNRPTNGPSESIEISYVNGVEDQYTKVISLMKKHGFRIKQKKQTELIEFSKEFSKSYNYIFDRD